MLNTKRRLEARGYTLLSIQILFGLLYRYAMVLTKIRRNDEERHETDQFIVT